MRVAALLLFLFLSPAIVAAQDADSFSGFAIRFQLRDDAAIFVPIQGSHGAVGFTVSPLQTDDHTYSTLVSMINLSADRRGDEWELKVSVTLPSEEKKLLASGRVKEAESITVEKFTGYDLFPSQVSIVRIDATPSTAPELVNKTTSLKAEEINPSVIPSPYQITFTNNSKKKVYGIEVIANNHSLRRSAGWLNSNCGNALIEPGGSYKAVFPSTVDRDYQLISANEYQVARVQNPRMEIATVVFADGTYEGEPQYAAILNAEAIGARHQITRVLPLIENAIASRNADALVIAALKESVTALDADVQLSDSEELRSRLNGLDERTINDAERSIGWGRNNVKVCVKRDIVDRNPTLTLHDWLSQEADKLKRWSLLFQ
ncbi:MAG TPA: hypothetical protein VF397_12490 [Pyrinomonadaceae bacterium]